MRINEFKYNGKSAIQVYLSNEELDDITILSELDNLKKKYKTVGIFVSGQNNFKDVASNVISSFNHIS